MKSVGRTIIYVYTHFGLATNDSDFTLGGKTHEAMWSSPLYPLFFNPKFIIAA